MPKRLCDAILRPAIVIVVTLTAAGCGGGGIRSDLSASDPAARAPRFIPGVGMRDPGPGYRWATADPGDVTLVRDASFGPAPRGAVPMPAPSPTQGPTQGMRDEDLTEFCIEAGLGICP